MDEFAQTRGADDLFDDEIIPVAPEEQVIPPPEPQSQPLSQPQTQVMEYPEIGTGAGASDPVADYEPATIPAPVDAQPRSRGERRGRGRGRGGRGRGAQQGPGQRRSDGSRNRPEDFAAEPEIQTGEATEGPAEAPGDEVEDPSKEDAAAEAPRVPAVRGDRSATGGVKKPKLTEEELSHRIAAAKENAAKKAAAHARAEADQASFMEREKVAEKKRREERQNRRVMDSERERNRQRKMNALGGREWDAEKPEEQFNSRGGGQFRRGMHGGVSGYTRSGFEGSQPGEESPDDNGQQYGHRGRGRGRGRGGRGGRGRGGHRDHYGEGPSDAPPQEKPAPLPIITNETEFPSLPGGEKKDLQGSRWAPAPTPAPAPALAPAPAPAPAYPNTNSKPLSPISGATWADQVEGE
ncbi:hypothetical protein BJX99DRAFT_238858 [Aspergillus californicus]